MWTHAPEGVSLVLIEIGALVCGFHLLAFIVLAFIRIFTGISIHRVGYLSLNHVGLSPAPGVHVDVRRIRLYLHRPSFARPSLVTVSVNDLHVFVDGPQKTRDAARDGPEPADDGPASPAARALAALARLQRAVQVLHRHVGWCKLVDLSVRSASLTVDDIGTAYMRTFNCYLDSKPVSAQSPHLYSVSCDYQAIKDTHGSVSLYLSLKDVHFRRPGAAVEELLDYALFELHDVYSFRTLVSTDIVVGFRVGNISVPFDTTLAVLRGFERRRAAMRRSSRAPSPPGDRKPSADCVRLLGAAERLMGMVREVQLHVTRIGVHHVSPQVAPSSTDTVSFSASTKDFTIDLRRLNPRSPGHRLLFPETDTSHQLILTAISTAIGINSDRGPADELLYVPMITSSVISNFICKSIGFFRGDDVDRNSSLLKASLTVSSPSVDLHAYYLPLLVATCASSRPRAEPRRNPHGTLIGRVLPRATIKFSVEEPAARITIARTAGAEHDQNLLVASCSTVNCELESSHLTEPTRYVLTAFVRVSDFSAWTRNAATAQRHQLTKLEMVMVKVVAETSPKLDVSVVANVDAFSFFLTRPEMINSLKDLVTYARRGLHKRHAVVLACDAYPGLAAPAPAPPMLLKAPAWLSGVRLEGSGIQVSLACTDDKVFNEARGISVQIESWHVEYKPHVTAAVGHHRRRHRQHSFSAPYGGEARPQASRKRRLAVEIKDIEICTVDAFNTINQDKPVAVVPDLDIAVTTQTHGERPASEIEVTVNQVTVNYSLYVHYDVLLALKAISRVFKGRFGRARAGGARAGSPGPVRTHVINAVIELPGAPPLLLTTNALEFIKRADGIPLVKAKHARLFVSSPSSPDAWERFVSIQQLRVEIKGNRNAAAAAADRAKSPSGDSLEDRQDQIVLNSTALSFSIPFGFILYRVLDGVVNSFKALKQLQHRYKTEDDDYILGPGPEAPKKLPRIRVCSKTLELRVDDDPFEAKLGLIFTTGLLEAKARLAREAAYDAKVQALRAADERRRQPEPRHRRAGSSQTAASAGADPARPDDSLPPTPPVKKRGTFRAMRAGKRKQKGTRKLRYSPTNAVEPSETCTVSIADAYRRLQEHNSMAWIQRISLAKKHRRESIEARRVQIIGGHDNVDNETAAQYRIIEIPAAPPLLHMLFSDTNILVDRPSYPLEDVPKFLHEIGKGMPYDKQFTLLVPLYFELNVGEVRALLRDYPLPALHVPPLAPERARAGEYAWACSSDAVIAEEFFDERSVRRVVVPVIPARVGSAHAGEYAIEVPRTVASVKMYSRIAVDIRSTLPTRISWAPSIQPAIQQVMQVFDSFTKPPVDPSEKVGFWDKIRLIFHSRMRLAWTEGDLHLLLKGSRDPYQINGAGSGFVMCWRNNVVWQINPTADPNQFMRVDSGEYILAIPDFSSYSRSSASLDSYEESASILSSFTALSDDQPRAPFRKIVMKLSGDVRWLVGVLFENELRDGQRSFDFTPHYDIQLKTPQSFRCAPAEFPDSYAGFRSHQIHLALSVECPGSRGWDPLYQAEATNSYNTVHLSPRAFTHFFKWWDLFSGAMSLPVRNGPLFPSQFTSSKKFGQYLATIKYKLVLSPMFISHMYLHAGKESKKGAYMTGLKGRTDSFMMDIHQRREQVTEHSKKGDGKRRRAVMRLNEGEIDCQIADIRGISVTFKERSPLELFQQLHHSAEAASAGSADSVDTGPTNVFHRVRLPDNDYTWIDVDDFVELDTFTGSANLSSMKVTPFLSAPRFTYHRQTHHSAADDADTFGREPSHECLLHKTDFFLTRRSLIKARLRELEQDIGSKEAALQALQRQAREATADHVIRAKVSAA
ncbi:mitochondrial protein from FMP27-domain-containing protein, partial [Dipodascopsis tothii]|uniref:mitochondrial protein from FMP27-domain-containing protein n=1 Tax=Dipodascopsis tothii TaxID=44089 RepID=UPI0034CD536A